MVVQWTKKLTPKYFLSKCNFSAVPISWKKNISTKFSCVSNFFSLLTNQILKWGMLFSHQWFSYNVQKRNLCWIHVPLSAASLLTKISPSFVFETLSCFSLISKDLDALLGLKKFLLKNTLFNHLVA